MKKVVFVLVASWLCFTAMAQDCDKLFADLKKGTLNGIKPTASQEKVKEKLPCFTGDTEDGSDFNCGGGVFYLNHDFFCYTGHDYIEMRSDFKGKLSIPVLGLDKVTALKKLGLGKVVRTAFGDDMEYVFFKTTYGCLVLTFGEDKVVRVGMHAKPAKLVELCL